MNKLMRSSLGLSAVALLYWGAACSSETVGLVCECPPGEVCVDDECHALCRKASDCADDLICPSGFCLRPPLACTQSEECGAGAICCAQTCARGICCDSTDCLAGQVCLDGDCAGCAGDEDCGADQVCCGNACSDGDCCDTTDCLIDQMCVARFCSGVEPCTAPLDCSGDLYVLTGVNDETWFGNVRVQAGTLARTVLGNLYIRP